MVSFSEIVVGLLGKLVVSFPPLAAPGLRGIRADSVQGRWFDNRTDLKGRKAGKRRVQHISSDFQPPFPRHVIHCESVPSVLPQPHCHIAHSRVAAGVVHQSRRLIAFVLCAVAQEDVVGEAAGHGFGEWGSGDAELFQDLPQGEAVMRHDLTKNGAQCAGAERSVVGDGQVMFAVGVRGKAAVRSDLPGKLLVPS